MVWRLDIKDKIEVRGDKPDLCCPPHCIPHKLPFTRPITDEPCHYHDARWRMAHHIPFCYMFCPHHSTMMKEYREHKEHREHKKHMRK
ncbi:hypothetical protein HQ545_01070 [Candidatus Woesearchaeota archaeon]|nr:hypothetical protein [Candidatus Woesearchaeota archaeon]